MHSESSRYTSFAVALKDGDKELIDSFFMRRNRKKARFVRDAIMEKIEREERVEASHTQIDTDALSDHSLIGKIRS